jgi:hypothetical protein
LAAESASARAAGSAAARRACIGSPLALHGQFAVHAAAGLPDAGDAPDAARRGRSSGSDNDVLRHGKAARVQARSIAVWIPAGGHFWEHLAVAAAIFSCVFLLERGGMPWYPVFKQVSDVHAGPN